MNKPAKTSEKRGGARRRLPWIKILIGIAAVLFLVFLRTPAINLAVTGYLRGETAYRGLPARYWLRELHEGRTADLVAGQEQVIPILKNDVGQQELREPISKALERIQADIDLGKLLDENRG